MSHECIACGLLTDKRPCPNCFPDELAALNEIEELRAKLADCEAAKAFQAGVIRSLTAQPDEPCTQCGCDSHGKSQCKMD